ncbi:hypothetical protein [Gordonia insulae]|uniref:Chromosome partition protein Smc n=1 Tax=Gordonia insulae TaxID=2420509 RepID=A0A3G8JPD8_9ACTN|nr:hypothetical protein [Gordonia insulae]AZG46818.1 hypothetical protein D7316_03423 [Gordonia insulae]
MHKTSWAITAAMTIALLVGLLILTRDLSISNDTFKDGVNQAATVNGTTDDALDGADQLQPADTATRAGMPEVTGIIGSLAQADQTLGELGTKLNQLGGALTGANTSLEGIITSGNSAVGQAQQAATSAGAIANRLTGINNQAAQISAELDNTQALSHTIDTKLRIALLLPKTPQ